MEDTRMKQVWMYFEKTKRLLLNPIGLATNPDWGTTAIPPVTDLPLPCEKEELKKAIQETFDNCYKVDGYNSPKEGPAQNYMGIKSQRKFVRIFETLLVLEWNKEEEYILKFWERDEQGSGRYDKKIPLCSAKISIMTTYWI